MFSTLSNRTLACLIDIHKMLEVKAVTTTVKDVLDDDDVVADVDILFTA